MKLKPSIVVLIVVLLISVGIAGWWYVYNHVVRQVEKAFEDGSSYKGGWLAGKMHGTGILILDNGDIYEGEFFDGRIQGTGRITYADSSYDGEWCDNLYHGPGIYTSPKGNVYEGVWQYGKLPEGVLKYTGTKQRYEGEMRDLSPDGFGVMEYQDGRVYLGYWNKGAKQGLGRLMYADGRMDFGYWFDGRLIRSGYKFVTGDEVYGIDISKYQKEWKWRDLALFADAEGRVYSGLPKSFDYVQPSVFVIMKATEGADMLDPDYASNVEKAREARIVKGAYHFMTTQSDIESQISNFISNAVVEKGDFPPVLDIETPEHRMKTVGVKNVQRMALQWLKSVEEHYGVRPVIYTNDRFRRKYLSGPEFSGYDFWIARYGGKEPSGDWLMWQYTQTGSVRGFSADVDLNVFSGNISDFRKYIDAAWN